MRDRIFEIFKIRAGEGPLVGLNLLQSFFIGLPRLFTFTVGSSLFLSHFDAGLVPLVYAANAVLVTAMGIVLSRVEKRVGYGTLLKSITGILTATLVVLWLLTTFMPGKVAAIATFIWLDAEWVLTNMVFWGGANTFFSVRQGKRMFSLIGNGEIAAMVVGGLLTPLLVGLVGTPNLLLFSLAGVVGAFLNLTLMYRRFGGDAPPEAQAEAPAPAAANTHVPWFTPYFVTIFATIGLHYFTYYIVDNTFLRALDVRYDNQDDMAGFLGVFFAGLGITTMIFKSFVSSRFIARYSLLGGLGATPTLLGLTALGVVLAGVFKIDVAVIFWLVVGAKLLDKVGTESFYRPTYYLLFQPMQAHERSAMQTRAEMIMSQVASGSIGLILLFLNQVLDISIANLAACLLPVVGLRLWYARRADQQYRGALTQMLRKRGFSGAELNLKDAAAIEIVAGRLETGSPQEVLYCLDLLDDAQYHGLESALVRLLSHDDVAVRRGAARKLQDLGSADCFDPLRDRIAVEDDAEALGALLRALAASDQAQAATALAGYTEDARPQVRTGALVGLARYGDRETARQAHERVRELATSEDQEHRRIAAATLAEADHPAAVSLLRTLLADQDDDVRGQALLAAAYVDDPTLWPLVFTETHAAVTRSAAIFALRQPDTGAAQALMTIYDSEATAMSDKLTVLRIIAKIGGDDVRVFLLNQLSADSEHVRTEAAHALCLMEYKAESTEDAERIRGLIAQEQALCLRAQWALTDVHEDETLPLTSNALDYDVEKARRRLLYLLSFLYPTDEITRIIDNYFTRHADSMAFAIELLDNTLSSELKKVLLPLFEADGELKADADAGATLRRLGREARINELVDSEDWRNAWVRTCAIHEGSGQRVIDAARLTSLAARHDAAYFREVVTGMSTEGVQTRLLIVDKVKRLRQVGMFAEVPDEVLAEIAGRFEELRVPAGDTFITQGDLSDTMYVIVAGSARVHLGDQEIVELGAGDIVGELAAIDPEPRSASVTAIDAVHLFAIDAGHLYELMTEHIEVTRGLIDALCRRLRATVERARAQGGSPTATRGNADVEPAGTPADPERTLSAIDKLIALKASSIFSGAPDSILSAVAEELQEQFLPGGEMLFEKGAIETTMFIVVAGRVKVHDGDMRIATLGPGDVIGELAALSAEARTASITAEIDTKLVSLERGALYELIWDQTEIAQGILKELVRRLRSML